VFTVKARWRSNISTGGRFQPIVLGLWQPVKGSSRSGWGFLGTWLDQLQRRTTTVSSPPRCDLHLIGGDQDPPGWEW